MLDNAPHPGGSEDGKGEGVVLDISLDRHTIGLGFLNKKLLRAIRAGGDFDQIVEGHIGGNLDDYSAFLFKDFYRAGSSLEEIRLEDGDFREFRLSINGLQGAIPRENVLVVPIGVLEDDKDLDLEFLASFGMCSLSKALKVLPNEVHNYISGLYISCRKSLENIVEKAEKGSVISIYHNRWRGCHSVFEALAPEAKFEDIKIVFFAIQEIFPDSDELLGVDNEYVDCPAPSHGLALVAAFLGDKPMLCRLDEDRSAGITRNLIEYKGGECWLFTAN
jgi:hypothetical protein